MINQIKKTQSDFSKVILIASLLLLLSMRVSFGQVAGSFYAGTGDTKVGVGYDFSPRVWADLRIYGGVTLDNLTPELTVNYNVSQKEVHDVYIGIGGSANGRNSIFIPIGFRVRPFQELRSLSLVVEAEPMYNIDIEDVTFIGFFGLRYVFRGEDQ